jgi:hypothetical protein
MAEVLRYAKPPLESSWYRVRVTGLPPSASIGELREDVRTLPFRAGNNAIDDLVNGMSSAEV